MSTIATSGSCASTSRSSSSAVAGLPGHLDPGLLEQRRDPLADEQVVVRDHDPHGSSAVIVVPAPGGLVTYSLPSSASTRSASPRRPGAAGVVGAADAVVGDLDLGERPGAPQAHLGVRRARVLRDVGERLARDEVGGQLHGIGEPLARLARHRRRDRRAVRQRVERGREPVLEHRRVHPARELAQLGQRLGELGARRRDQLRGVGVVADPVLQQAQLQRDRHQPLLRAVVQVALEPPALGVAGGDDPLARCLQLVEPHVGLGQEALVLERDGRRRAGGLEQLGILVERGVVDERGDLPPVALDRRDGAAGTRGRGPLQRQLQARIAERAPERRLQVRGARRPEPAEQVGEAAARQPRAQQPGQERQRHGHERAGRDPQQRLRARSRDQVGDEQRREAQQREGAGEARQQRAAPRPRRRPPSGDDHDDGDEAADHEHAALDPVDRVRDVRVREGEQQVALLGVGHHPRDLQDPQRDRVRGHEQAVEARLQPPARQQRQDQRDEREDPVVDEQDPQRARELALHLAEQRRARRTGSPSRPSAARCGCPDAGATRAGRTPRTSRRRA